MAGGQGRPEAVVGELAEHLETGDRVGQDRRLGEAGQVELVVGILECQLGEIVAQHLARLVVDPAHDRVLGVQVAAHAAVLGALAGEQEEDVLCGVGHGLGSPVGEVGGRIASRSGHGKGT